ncbi:unnamed protein product (macronuclear) [Paramecium tetraurelia]|uniref:EF-hand domain-containing protein n=1 Tax=Paramecium tetraurelia TaxID=5888 RepID=A0D3K3_PARTE|nr:uncharacterized protein GSPATT00013108001 [Paramecium tetraurelia]CAK77620.1 unnamed protein product [Paramecium tetraurelia]|eukprot:XP_001445017.1 hypothetical protein (macronuclear) [Paramecium tetraurelia strain d4-2]
MGNSNLTQTCNQDISQSCQQNSGLTEQEIEGIKNVFNSLDPKDGVISTETLRKLYRDSYDAPKLNDQIGNRESLTFQEFFEVMRINMLEKKKNFPNVEFNDMDGNVQCFFCQP